VNLEIIKSVASEVEQLLQGRFLFAVHQLDTFTLVLDFRLRENGFLLISTDPKRPRMYLITRRSRELEKAAISAGPFAQFIVSALRGAQLISVMPDETERIVWLTFRKQQETGEEQRHTLVAQLTGRSANLFLVSADGVIQQALRRPKGEGQQVGDRYQRPPPNVSSIQELMHLQNEVSVSASLDEYFTQLEREERFVARVQAIQERYKRQLAQKRKLVLNLHDDLRKHGDALEHKRVGDLLLANIGTAERAGRKVVLRDYYSEGTPTLELELDEKTSLQEEAARYFARYAKAKRAQEEIQRRLAETKHGIEALSTAQSVLDEIVATHNADALCELEEELALPGARQRKQPQPEKLPGIRRYRSSDEYEILVGKAATTNDRLTFKIARPNDLWFHASDYPGSHVIVRNSSRKEVPHRTIVEAAQLAAKFSQAGDDSKVKVNYTHRKFLAKPKGAAPGLVRLSRFKSITVTPKEAVERIM